VFSLLPDSTCPLFYLFQQTKLSHCVLSGAFRSKTVFYRLFSRLVFLLKFTLSFTTLNANQFYFIYFDEWFSNSNFSHHLLHIIAVYAYFNWLNWCPILWSVLKLEVTEESRAIATGSILTCPPADDANVWNHPLHRSIEMELLEEIENMEEKVCHASLQVCNGERECVRYSITYNFKSKNIRSRFFRCFYKLDLAHEWGKWISWMDTEPVNGQLADQLPSTVSAWDLAKICRLSTS